MHDREKRREKKKGCLAWPGGTLLGAIMGEPSTHAGRVDPASFVAWRRGGALAQGFLFFFLLQANGESPSAAEGLAGTAWAVPPAGWSRPWASSC